MAQKKSKLHPRGEGSFHILKRINDISYKVDFPGEVKSNKIDSVSVIFIFIILLYFIQVMKIQGHILLKKEGMMILTH